MLTSPIARFWTLGVAALVILSQFSVLDATAQTMHDPISDSIQARVDEIFKGCDKPNSPGAAVAVLKNGERVLCRGYGAAQLEYHIPVTPATVFRVASMSKQFTAMAITMLEKQEMLSIDDEIHEYLPDLPDFGEPITIRHLLHHTSGLRDDLTLWILAGNSIEDVITQKDLLALVQHQNQLNFPPGSRYGYSDTNYDLLAEIVSVVTGESFSDWTEKNIFSPLWMTSSRFVEDHAMPIEGRAYCYEKDDSGGYRNVLLNMGWVGSSGLHTTVEDMSRWMANFETMEVGGEEVFEDMLTRGVLSSGEQIAYARGVRIEEHDGRKVMMHSGTNGGFFCHMSYFPDDRLGVVVLSNFPSGPWDMVDQVADLFLHPSADDQSVADQDERQSPSPLERTPAVLTEDQLAACAGSYWYQDSWNWLVRDVVTEDGKLYYVRSEENRTELVPHSDTEFLLANTDDLIVQFSDEINGRFTTLTFNSTSQKPSKAVRVEPFELSLRELKEYEGLYYAEELDALHRLVVRGGELCNTKFRYAPDTPWVPVANDRFVFLDREGHVSFRRDEGGKITGYVIDFTRAENILFEKLQ